MLHSKTNLLSLLWFNFLRVHVWLTGPIIFPNPKLARPIKTHVVTLWLFSPALALKHKNYFTIFLIAELPKKKTEQVNVYHVY